MTVATVVGLRDVPPAQMPLWRSALRGFSQCAFQANEITAVLFIAAAAAYDLRMAAFYVISVFVATMVARLLPADRELLGLGLLGFNSGLIGLALGNFFVPSVRLWVAVPVLAAVVAAVTVLAARALPFPFLAAPFIVTFWLLWPAAGSLGLATKTFPPFPDDVVQLLKSLLSALGSTLFAGAALPGALFLAGLLVAAWRHAVVALVGALLASLLAMFAGIDGVAINTGFVSFNAVLAALAAYSLLKRDLRLVVAASLLSSVIFGTFSRHWPAPALASGFVLSIWFLMLLDRLNAPFNRNRTGPAGIRRGPRSSRLLGR